MQVGNLQNPEALKGLGKVLNIDVLLLNRDLAVIIADVDAQANDDEQRRPQQRFGFIVFLCHFLLL